jgi:hypothetical protein
MKRFALLLVAGVVVVITSCGGHGPPCAAYSSVKKIQSSETAMALKTKTVKPL